MGRRMEPKDENELILDDKLDMFRTLNTLKHRQEIRREKNAGEAAIKQSHMEEVNSGEVTQPVIPSTEEQLALLASKRPAITSGEQGTDTDDDHQEDKPQDPGLRHRDRSGRFRRSPVGSE